MAIPMRANQTFFHNNGYVFKGMEFEVQDQAQADNYKFIGVAEFVNDSDNVNGINVNLVGDLKQIPTGQVQNNENLSISQYERNVTSVSDSIEIKLTITGVSQDQVKVTAENANVEHSSTQSNSQSHAQINESQAQSQTQSQNVSQQSQQSQASQNQSQQSGGQSQAQSSQPTFEVKHLGGGWYLLPNGEKVQGKDNVEPRMKELFQAGQLSGQDTQLTENTREMAQQVNAPANENGGQVSGGVGGELEVRSQGENQGGVQPAPNAEGVNRESSTGHFTSAPVQPMTGAPTSGTGGAGGGNDAGGTIGGNTNQGS